MCLRSFVRHALTIFITLCELQNNVFWNCCFFKLAFETLSQVWCAYCALCLHLLRKEIFVSTPPWELNVSCDAYYGVNLLRRIMAHSMGTYFIFSTWQWPMLYPPPDSVKKTNSVIVKRMTSNTRLDLGGWRLTWLFYKNKENAAVCFPLQQGLLKSCLI